LPRGLCPLVFVIIFGQNIERTSIPEESTARIDSEILSSTKPFIPTLMLGSLTPKSQKLYDSVVVNVKKALRDESCRMHAECAILLL
jgi:hypothetical protein